MLVTGGEFLLYFDVITASNVVKLPEAIYITLATDPGNVCQHTWFTNQEVIKSILNFDSTNIRSIAKLSSHGENRYF